MVRDGEPGRGVKVHNLASAGEAYKEYVHNLNESKIRLGWPAIDQATRGFVRGDVVILLARSGVGKSAFAQTFQLDVWKRHQTRSIFFSLEMPITSIFERAASISTGWSEDDIEEMYTSGQESRVISDMEDCIEGGVFLVDKSGLSLNNMQRIVEKTGNIGLIVIDYLGLVGSPYTKTQYERISDVAKQLKELAKEANAVVLCIAQTSRVGGDGTERISLDSARDSGVIEESADVILGMHRDSQDDKVLHLYVLKSRRGRAGAETRLSFEGETPRIYELQDRYAETYTEGVEI